MKTKDKRRKEKPAVRTAGAGEHQTDLAEGELETVEESIRVHERKGDLTPAEPSENRGKKKTK